MGGGAGTVKLFKGWPCPCTLLAACDSASTLIPGAYEFVGGTWATGGGWLKFEVRTLDDSLKIFI